MTLDLASGLVEEFFKLGVILKIPVNRNYSKEIFSSHLK